jgi:sRNA-binding protein
MSTLEATLELLRKKFPNCFARRPQPPRPLKIGIHRDARAALAGTVSVRALRRALTAYVNDPAYRAQLKPGAVRIDLSGQPAGVVTPEQIPPPPKPKAPPHGSHSPTSNPKRLSLADLKAAAVARRVPAGKSP